MRFTPPGVAGAILLDPELAAGEACVNCTLCVENGMIADFLALALSQDHSGNSPYWAGLQWLVRFLRRRLAQFNVRGRSRRNVSHHYGLDGRHDCVFREGVVPITRDYLMREDARLRTRESGTRPPLRLAGA